MAKIKLDIPHSLSVADAKTRLEALLNYWARKYSVKGVWNGEVASFNGKAMGVAIEGQLTVALGKLLVDSADPGFLLRGQAEKYLRRKLADYLDPKKTLADLARED